MRHEDLQVFLEIAEVRNLRRAADRLGTTQSALTKVLRRLESELRIRLFDRAPRGVELTEPGRAFHVRVKAVDIQLTQALHELEDMRLGELGVVRFGSTPGYYESVVKPVIDRFLLSRPHGRFVLFLDGTSSLMELLVSGQVDLLLAGLPGRNRPEVDHLPLIEESMHVVVRAGHQLLEPSTSVPDLANCRWMLPPPGRITTRWLEQRLHELGLPPPRVALESDATLALTSSTLRSSNLASVMMGHMLRSSCGAGLLALDRLVGYGTQRLALSWRRDAYLSPFALEFRTAIEEALRPT